MIYWVTFNIICDLLVDRRIAKWNLLDKLIRIFKVWSNVTLAAFTRPLFTEEICTVGRQLVSSLRYLSSGGSFLVWRSIDWYQFLSYSSILLCYKCRSVLGLCDNLSLQSVRSQRHEENVLCNAYSAYLFVNIT